MGEPAAREQEEDAWAVQAAGDPSAIDELVELLRTPPTDEERGRVSAESFEGQLTHILTAVGRTAQAASWIASGRSPMPRTVVRSRSRSSPASGTRRG